MQIGLVVAEVDGGLREGFFVRYGPGVGGCCFARARWDEEVWVFVVVRGTPCRDGGDGCYACEEGSQMHIEGVGVFGSDEVNGMARAR